MTTLNVPQRIIKVIETVEQELTAREIWELLNQDSSFAIDLKNVRAEVSRLTRSGRLIRNDKRIDDSLKFLAHYSLPSSKPVISDAPANILTDEVVGMRVPKQPYIPTFSDNQPLRTAQAIADKKSHEEMMSSSTYYKQGYEYGRGEQASQIKDAPTPVASAEGATANASEQANEAKPKKVLVTDNYRMGYGDGFNDGFQKAIELAKLGLI